MSRKRYRALVGLAYPTDAKIIARLKLGEPVEYEPKQVAAGEVVDDIPAISLPWLLEQGAIEEVPEDG